MLTKKGCYRRHFGFWKPAFSAFIAFKNTDFLN
jgi:hypothetical protein